MSSPRAVAAAAGAIAFAVVAATIAFGLAVAPPASAHEGNVDYRSIVDSVRPAIAGLTVEVVNYDDSLELRNRSGRAVTVLGYDGEPYARLHADGRVEVNRRSPATYLNSDRDAAVAVPASADPRAAPRWELLDRTGRLAWHDHRIHWMGGERPAKVSDPNRRTKVSDWRVPIRVGGRDVTVAGTLWWQPPQGAGGPPAAAIAALVALAIAGAVAVAAVRRRRRRHDASTAADSAPASGEAW